MLACARMCVRVCACMCVRARARVFRRTTEQGGGATRWDPRQRKEKQKYGGEVTDWFDCTARPTVHLFFYFPTDERGHLYDDADDLVPDGAAS